MTSFKKITLILLFLFPLSSFATIATNRLAITNGDKANIVFSLEKKVIGDVYIVKELNGVFEYLNKTEKRWIAIDKGVAEPYVKGRVSAGKIKGIVVSSGANGVKTPAGIYSFFLVVVQTDQDPFNDANWLSFESQAVYINKVREPVDNLLPLDPELINPEPALLDPITILFADQTTLDHQDKTTVEVGLNATELSDQYIIAEHKGQHWFLNNEGSFSDVAVPFASNVTIVEEKTILTINADQMGAGKYHLYHLVTKAEETPFAIIGWQASLEGWVDEENKLTFLINLGNR